MKESLRATAIRDVLLERKRQDELWGEQNHKPADWYPLFAEEWGEAAEAYNDGDMEHYRKELVQAAAVIVQMIECFDRNKGEG